MKKVLSRHQDQLHYFIRTKFSETIPETEFTTKFNPSTGGFIIILNESFLISLSEFIRNTGGISYREMIHLLESRRINIFRFIDVPLANQIRINSTEENNK